MAGPESEHIYGIQLRESANDGSDFPNADADYRIAFLGEDGLWHVKDSSGTVTEPNAAGGGVTVQDEGSPLSTTGTTLNFVGSGVVASGTGATKTITIAGASTSDPVTDIFGAADTAFEFGSNDFTGLTAIGSPTTESMHATVPGHLFYKDTTSTSAIMGRYLASPSTPFTAVTKITDFNGNANYNSGGLLVGTSNPTTGALVVVSLQNNSGRNTTSPVVAAEKWTNRTTYGSDQASDAASHMLLPCYIGVVVNSTTSIDYYWSKGGSVWRKFGSAVNPSMTVASVGLQMAAQNASGCSIAFDYLRIWNSAKTFPGA